VTDRPHTSARSVSVPASWVTSGRAMPAHCARHGLPAARRADFALQSRPQMPNNQWTNGNLFSTVGRLSDRARRVKVVRVQAWPLCARCARTRAIWLTAAQILFWGGLAAAVGAIVARILADEPSPVLGIPLLGGFALVLASPFVLQVAALGRITQAETSADGSQVLVRDAHPAFVEEMARLMSSASGDNRG
jgi:hypothetical protein